MKDSATLWHENERTGKKTTNSCLPLKLSLLLAGGEDFTKFCWWYRNNGQVKRRYTRFRLGSYNELAQCSSRKSFFILELAYNALLAYKQKISQMSQLSILRYIGTRDNIIRNVAENLSKPLSTKENILFRIQVNNT